jgi:hypothetical protein
LAARESFLLRTDPKLLEALRRWAADELRSVNGQVEYVLRRALAEAGRLTAPAGSPEPPSTAGTRPQDLEGNIESQAEDTDK